MKWPLSEQLIVRCAQLLLALPAVDPSPVDGLMDFCAATQLPPGEGEINDVPAEVSAQNALLRGSLWAEIDVFFLACVMPLMLMGEPQRWNCKTRFEYQMSLACSNLVFNVQQNNKNTDDHYGKPTKRQ